MNVEAAAEALFMTEDVGPILAELEVRVLPPGYGTPPCSPALREHLYV